MVCATMYKYALCLDVTGKIDFSFYPVLRGFGHIVAWYHGTLLSLSSWISRSTKSRQAGSWSALRTNPYCTIQHTLNLKSTTAYSHSAVVPRHRIQRRTTLQPSLDSTLPQTHQCRRIVPERARPYHRDRVQRTERPTASDGDGSGNTVGAYSKATTANLDYYMDGYDRPVQRDSRIDYTIRTR